MSNGVRDRQSSMSWTQKRFFTSENFFTKKFFSGFGKPFNLNDLSLPLIECHLFIYKAPGLRNSSGYSSLKSLSLKRHSEKECKE